jgi:RNA polymerase sigma-70 factor, ECF subfamily
MTNLSIDQDRSSWAQLVVQIQNGNTNSVEYLYRAVEESSRSRLRRRVDRELVDDKLHDVLVSVLEAIYSNELRDPSRLMGFVSTVARRRIANHIRTQIDSRRRVVKLELSECPALDRDSPEASALDHDRKKLIARFFRKISARDREILVRFYLREESPKQICQQMSLSATQFRLFKSRALARCTEYARTGPFRKPPASEKRHSHKSLRTA